MWPFKKKQAVVESPKKEIDTKWDGMWLQLKKPAIYEDFKLTPNGVGYVKDKNDKLITASKRCRNMYIKFFTPTEYESFSVGIFPIKSLQYQGKCNISFYNSVEEKANVISRYEIVTNPKLAKKLNCAVRKYHADKEKEEESVSATILKASLAHKCEE